ncbi:AhpC/TSA antioxidant enzyme-domain-containing protein [Cyathus striatus]|nr:AhpC/TSA antioxidant enzyme-domain-containing protein [Cyathus striatus]
MNTNTIAEAAKILIYNSKGEQVPFGSLFEGQKTIVVFIRHFFCGNCQQYVTQLGSIPHEHLHAANARIVVIGCGEWNAIANYSETTGFPDVGIYADPKRDVYHALGMTTETLKGTPSGEQKKSYLTMGVVKNALLSIWQGPVKNPRLAGKQGNISQLGGEFVLGAGHTCWFESRMRHTEDHTEVEELLRHAGISGSQ